MHRIIPLIVSVLLCGCGDSSANAPMLKVLGSCQARSIVPNDISTDLDDNPRFVDDPDTADTGIGSAPIIDMGAYEFQSCPP